METRHANLAIFALTVATLVYDAFVNPSLPGIVPSHWNIYGQVDAHSPKLTMFFLLLLPLALIALVINLLPRLRVPAGMNPSSTIGNYISVASAVFLCGVNGVVLQTVLHPALLVSNSKLTSKLIFTGTLLLLMLLGNVLGKTRRNPYTGIRLPWTLASDANWIATHRMAGRLWVGASLAGIVLLWLGLPMTVLLPAYLLLILVAPILFSYLLFKRTNGIGEEPA